MGIFDQLFSGDKQRITAEELGQQFAGIALKCGFAEDKAIANIFEAAGVSSTDLDARREILAFAAAPLDLVVAGSLGEATADRVRDSLARHLLAALRESVRPEHQAKINWDTVGSALFMRMAEYRSRLIEDSEAGDSRQGMLLMAGRAYKNIAKRNSVDPEIMMLLAARLQLAVQHMGPVVRRYIVD